MPIPEDASPISTASGRLRGLAETDASQTSGPPYIADSAAPRTGVGVASDGNTLYMVGGTSRRNVSPGTIPTCTSTSTFSRRCRPGPSSGAQGRAPDPRGGLAAALDGGLLYAVGGFQYTGTPTTDPLLGQPAIVATTAAMNAVNNLEVYNPATDTWSVLAPMPTARYGLALVAASGRLYALGGSSTPGQALATVESYDPIANSWRTEPSMPTARALVGATVLDGTIRDSGGVGSDGRALRTVEGFNPGGLAMKRWVS